MRGIIVQASALLTGFLLVLLAVWGLTLAKEAGWFFSVAFPLMALVLIVLHDVCFHLTMRLTRRL